MKRFGFLMAAAGVAAMAAGTAHAQSRGHGQDWSFEALDVDGSGEITVEDLTALREGHFAEIDSDGDGSVSEAEFVAHAQARSAERATEMFQRMDVDGDGVLSEDAMQGRMGRGGGMGARMISRFDADNSGGVSAEEFEAAKERFAGRGKDRGRRHGN